MFPNLPTPPASPATPSNPSGNTMSGPIASEALNGNSLTQYLRSLSNYLGSQGSSTFGYGQNLVGGATSGVKTAGDTSMGASSTLAPSTDYWQAILSGDQNAINRAISPYASQVSQNNANLTTQANQNLPRGGYAAGLTAQLPFMQSAQVNNALMNLQPQAAAALNTNAGTQAGIAGVQGQLAQILGSLGINVSQLGSGLLDQAGRNQLQVRGQDVNEHNQNVATGGQLAGQTSSDFTKAFMGSKGWG